MKRSALVLSLGLTLGCNSTPADLREWRASDHDHTNNPTAGQVDVSADAGSSPASRHGVNEVAIVAWQQNCITCHGPLGRGDGPQGPSLRATDLSNPAWQAATKDETIARTIREGRGTMPGFNLPGPTIDSLVKLVRLLNAERFARERDAGIGDAGTTDDAAPPAAGNAAASQATRPPSQAHQTTAPTTPKTSNPVVPSHP